MNYQRLRIDALIGSVDRIGDGLHEALDLYQGVDVDATDPARLHELQDRLARAAGHANNLLQRVNADRQRLVALYGEVAIDQARSGS